MEAEVTHITKDITGEWRDIGAPMDQWIQECPYNCACIKGGECEHERYQYGYWPVCMPPSAIPGDFRGHSKHVL